MSNLTRPDPEDPTRTVVLTVTPDERATILDALLAHYDKLTWCEPGALARQPFAQVPVYFWEHFVDGDEPLSGPKLKALYDRLLAQFEARRQEPAVVDGEVVGEDPRRI